MIKVNSISQFTGPFIFLFITQSINAHANFVSSDKDVQWSNEAKDWKKYKRNIEVDVAIDPSKSLQTFEGCGGCFNEESWKVRKYLKEDEQKVILNLLFSDDGCSFSYCRMPIGASDYALDYYSLNHRAGDYEMKYFSIDRDRKYLLPYMKAAQEIRPDLKVWGSLWIPPAWMKENNSYNKGKIKMDPQTLNAYALYFQKYVKMYRNEGVDIVAVHPQNEPLHLPAFPSCGWSGDQPNVFIRDYLGPRFKRELPDCEIWLGTINGNDQTDEYSEYIQKVFGDQETSQFLTGASFQWYGDAAVEGMVKNFPEKKIMQTETKCGWGANDWKYAFEIYNQMVWYLERNTSYYLQWNMILNKTEMSSWGRKQNSIITVDTFDKTYKVNPQYWVVKHLTHYIRPNATRIKNINADDIQAVVFKNTDDSVVVVLSNQAQPERSYRIKYQNQYVSFSSSPNTVSTVLIN